MAGNPRRKTFEENYGRRGDRVRKLELRSGAGTTGEPGEPYRLSPFLNTDWYTDTPGSPLEAGFYRDRGRTHFFGLIYYSPPAGNTVNQRYPLTILPQGWRRHRYILQNTPMFTDPENTIASTIGRWWMFEWHWFLSDTAIAGEFDVGGSQGASPSLPIAETNFALDNISYINDTYHPELGDFFS
jgi:hypothetical protein